LNDNIAPYLWRNENQRHQVLSNDPPFSPPVMYNRPPPSPSAPPMLPSSPPTITDLAPKIIASTDKLFFIAYKIGASACHKWRLVHVVFTGSISLYPSAFQDGWVLVKFYVLYPSDVRYNATNQRYWL
jgi:hypothetical protein